MDKNFENQKNKRNLNLFSLTFWITFIGISVFVGVVILLSTLIKSENTSLQNTNYNKEIAKAIPSEYKKYVDEVYKLNKYLSEYLNEIFSIAIEKTNKNLGLLRKKHLKSFENYVSEELNDYFNVVEKNNVPKFLDWFYSWGTDYIVAYHSVKKLIDNDTYLENRIKILLFNPKNYQVFLERRVIPRMKEEYYRFLEDYKAEFKKNLREVIEDKFKKAFPQMPKDIKDRVLNQILQRSEGIIIKHISEVLTTKIATGTALLVVLKIYKKIPAKVFIKVSKKFISVLLEKLAAKIGTKLAGVTEVSSAFAVGTAACLETGPFAVFCGIGAAVAAELAADYTFTKLDELITRDSMQKEVVNILEDAKLMSYKEIVSQFNTLLRKTETALSSSSDLKIKDVIN